MPAPLHRDGRTSTNRKGTRMSSKPNTILEASDLLDDILGFHQPAAPMTWRSLPATDGYRVSVDINGRVIEAQHHSLERVLRELAHHAVSMLPPAAFL